MLKRADQADGVEIAKQFLVGDAGVTVHDHSQLELCSELGVVAEHRVALPGGRVRDLEAEAAVRQDEDLVGSRRGAVTARVGDHDHLRRPGERVDAHDTEHLTLGLGHVGVTGLPAETVLDPLTQPARQRGEAQDECEDQRGDGEQHQIEVERAAGDVATVVVFHDDGVAAIEVNISCPNVANRGLVFACNLGSAQEVMAEVRKNAPSGIPLLAKLSPDVTDIVEIARGVVEAGADGLSMINTLLGMVIDPVTLRPKLGGRTAEMFALRFLEDYTNGEIADIFGVSTVVVQGGAQPEFEIQPDAARLVQTSTNVPAMAASGVQEAIGRAAAAANLQTIKLPSGAGHDAQQVVNLAPMGMIFVPSVGGISHSPRELTSWDDCAHGADVLLRTVLELDQRDSI